MARFLGHCLQVRLCFDVPVSDVPVSYSFKIDIPVFDVSGSDQTTNWNRDVFARPGFSDMACLLGTFSTSRFQIPWKSTSRFSPSRVLTWLQTETGTYETGTSIFSRMLCPFLPIILDFNPGSPPPWLKFYPNRHPDFQRHGFRRPGFRGPGFLSSKLNIEWNKLERVSKETPLKPRGLGQELFPLFNVMGFLWTPYWEDILNK